MTVQVGAMLPFTGQIPVTAAAREAERAGLASIWHGDHLVWSTPYLDSTAQLAAAAAVTERITVGYGVMLPALRPTAWAAKQIATVQHISRGRLQVGVGIGPTGPEWRAAGTTATGRTARTDTFLELLPDLLAGHPVDPAGGDRTIQLEPPVPMPPVWIGGFSDAALDRVVRNRAGWLVSALPPPALAKRVQDLRSRQEQAGVTGPVATMVFATPLDDAGSDAARSVVDYVHQAYGLDRETAEAIVHIGPPERLAEDLNRYAEAGAEHTVVVSLGRQSLDDYAVVGAARDLLTT